MRFIEPVIRAKHYVIASLAALSFLFASPVSAFNFASTSVTVLLVCGDGIKEATELCDTTEFGSTTCADFMDYQGNPFNLGELSCNSTCDAISPAFCSRCGNGKKEGYEQCDSTDFGSSTCATFGYNTGSLSCSANCSVSIMNCSSVGLTEPGDQGTQGGGSGGGGSGGGGGGGGGVGTGLPGFLPGSDTAPKDTKVVIAGKAYPGSEVNILVDGKEIGIVKADTKADFYFETDKITPGVIGLGLWAQDSLGRKSALQTITFRVSSGAVTTVTGAYLAPSIDIDKPVLAQGEILKVSGQTVPESNVSVYFHSNTEVVRGASSSVTGDWLLNFNTQPLESEAYHVVKAVFELKSNNNVIKSGYSKAINFYVGKNATGGACPGADLNKDKKVNLVDFSILLFYWGTPNTCADQNSNKKVDLIDFSIMLYNWTG